MNRKNILWFSAAGTAVVLLGIVINFLVTVPHTKYITIDAGAFTGPNYDEIRKIEQREQLLAKIAQGLMVAGTLMVIWGYVLKK